MAHPPLTTYDRRDEQQHDRHDEVSLSMFSEIDRRDANSLHSVSPTEDRSDEQTVNRKATDAAPGSVRVRGQVTVRSTAPTWEGGR